MENDGYYINYAIGNEIDDIISKPNHPRCYK